MSAIAISSSIRDYEVRFVENDSFVADFSRFPFRSFAVDETVWKLYRKGLLRPLESEDVIPVVIREQNKTLDGVGQLYDHLAAASSKRNTTLISIGGGILQDISGFAASTLYRGINWVFVPTTLLAQSDSCIGSKTSLNYKGFKNLIGTFYPPSEVIVHVPFVETQEEVDYFSGLGEIVKLHLLGGDESTREIVSALPSLVRREKRGVYSAILKSLSIKKGYITGDEFDTGRRNLLNFGHCFGHALESTSHFEVPHGQAVVAGMMLANIVAKDRGILTSSVFKEINTRILIPCLKTKPKSEHLVAADVVQAMKKDKKRTGEGLALIMMADGYVFRRTNDLAEAEVDVAIRQFRNLAAI